MIISKRLFFALSYFIICNPLFSMEDNSFDYLLHPKSITSMSSYVSTHDANGYAQTTGYVHIQRNFMDRVLEKKSETLEICAGQGQVLEAILKKRNESPDSPAIRYTVVEKDETNIKKIGTIYKTHSETTDWLGSAQKDLVEFLETNLEKKLNKYDQVFGGFALNIFAPQSFVAIIEGLYNVMKDGAYLYLTQPSYTGEGYGKEYIQNVKSGLLLPFWANEEFRSDPVSMSKLLNDFGFNVIQVGLYQDINPFCPVSAKYLGIIAQKKKDFYKAERVLEYKKTAELLFFVELNCKYDPSGNKARWSPAAREGSFLWCIQDQKVSKEYDALRVYSRNINAKDIVVDKFELHNNNKNTVRALNTFLLMVEASSYGYESIFAKVVEGDRFCKVLKSNFAFAIDESYQESSTLQNIVQLKTTVSSLKVHFKR